MIRYTVLWDAEVETQFTNAWVSGDGPVRAALTEIANWIDQNLTESPDQKGQLRNDLDIRVLAVPLSSSVARVAVTYQVSPEFACPPRATYGVSRST
jgi:hypothetical protein